MHNCPSCKKSTSNLLMLDDGPREDVCDECTLIACLVGAPVITDEDAAAMIFSSLEEMVLAEAQFL